jgi:exopolysaccharide biosynthesis predicted pyruvyltransferase EpsI
MKVLNDFFKKFSERNVLFVRACQGNWGDGVIRLGAYKLAWKNNITTIRSWERPYTPKHFKNFKKENYPKINLVYVHGSGGIGTIYTGVAKAANYAHNAFPDVPIVYGPTTIMLNQPYYTEKDIKTKFTDMVLNLNYDKICVDLNDYLVKLLNDELRDVKNFSDFVFFARERTSYKFMKDNFDFKVKLDHCPSLHLEKNDFDLEKSVGGRALFERVDLEKSKRPEKVSPISFDLVTDPIDSKDNNVNSYEDWYKLHDRFDEIVTNRLHSAIMGIIFGKKVSLYDNHYHKNRSVWEYSLKSKGVEWIGV